MNYKIRSVLIGLIIHNILSANIFVRFASRMLSTAHSAITSRPRPQQMAIGTAASAALLAGAKTNNTQSNSPEKAKSPSDEDTPEYVPLIIIDDETNKQIPVWFDRRYYSPLIGLEMIWWGERFNKSASILSGNHAWWQLFGPTFSREEVALPLVKADLEKYYDRDKDPKSFDEEILNDHSDAPLKPYNLQQAPSALQKFSQERYGKDTEKVEYYDDRSDSNKSHEGTGLLLLKLSNSAASTSAKNNDQAAIACHALGLPRLWVDSKFRKIVNNDATMQSLGYKPGMIKCSKGPNAICIARVNGTKFCPPDKPSDDTIRVG